MSIAIKMIGRSVIRGAQATLIPSFMLYCNVSVITSINKGPGEIPALNPKITPENKTVSSLYNLYSLYLAS